jgi:hypothetical protein
VGEAEAGGTRFLSRACAEVGQAGGQYFPVRAQAISLGIYE